MIDTLIQTLKGVLPDSTWDFIFSQFDERNVRMTKPSYAAVRVSKNYMLVRIPQETPK
jgi:hypothetical protein